MPGLFERLGRLVRHRYTEWQMNRALPPAKLQELEAVIARSELSHTGQVRVCVEPGLPWSYIWRGADARERAVNMFGKLRVWDTEHNNGVLIYLLLADHAIEIVADRALARTMTQEQWQTLLSDMQSAFQGGHFHVGLQSALERVSQQLAAHFPRKSGSPSLNELPDAPVVPRHLG